MFIILLITDEFKPVKCEETIDYTGQVLRDVLRVEVGHDAADEVLSHNDGPDSLPVRHVVAQQQTYGLERHLDDSRRVGHTPHLYQLLLLDLFHGCDMQTRNVQYACSTTVYGHLAVRANSTLMLEILIHPFIHTASSAKRNKKFTSINK